MGLYEIVVFNKAPRKCDPATGLKVEESVKFLNLQESIDLVVAFLVHYCNETKSENLRTVVSALQKVQGNIKQNIHLLDWETYLIRARNDLNPKQNIFKGIAKLFSEQEVYDAMLLLLEERYKKYHEDDIGGCLSDLAYCDYGETADPAMAYFGEIFLCKIQSKR
jgi:hypothetical protein